VQLAVSAECVRLLTVPPWHNGTRNKGRYGTPEHKTGAATGQVSPPKGRSVYTLQPNYTKRDTTPAVHLAASITHSSNMAHFDRTAISVVPRQGSQKCSVLQVSAKKTLNACIFHRSGVATPVTNAGSYDILLPRFVYWLN
jgi:hypothetical protein